MIITTLGRSYLENISPLKNGDSVFHRNFESNPYLLRKLNSLPTFYKDLLRYWSEVSHCDINCAELILSESLWYNCIIYGIWYNIVWYNTFIKIDANTVYFEEFSFEGINKVKDLFEKDGKLKEFDKLRQDNSFLSCTRSFQYKILNNAIFFNKGLFKFGIIESPACSFCGQVDESPIRHSENKYVT